MLTEDEITYGMEVLRRTFPQATDEWLREMAIQCIDIAKQFEELVVIVDEGES